MTRNLGVVAALALAALVFGIAAPAVSANWTHEGFELEEDAAVEVSGTVGFNLTGSETGADANPHMEWFYFRNSTTGTVKSYVETNCTPKGLFAFLSCTSTGQNLPWVFHAQGGDRYLITGFSLSTRYYVGSNHTGTPTTMTTLSGNVTATPDNAEATSSVTLSGEELTLNENAAEINGILGLSPGGTYGMT